MKPINIGLLGIGTVGGGTFTVLARNQEEISRRAGRAIGMKLVADKDLERARTLVDKRAAVTADAREVVDHPQRPAVAGAGRLGPGRARVAPRGEGEPTPRIDAPAIPRPRPLLRAGKAPRSSDMRRGSDGST